MTRLRSRTEARAGISDHDRIERAEEDLDTVDDRLDGFAERLDKLNGILLGILISIVTGVTVVIVTLAVTR